MPKHQPERAPGGKAGMISTHGSSSKVPGSLAPMLPAPLQRLAAPFTPEAILQLQKTIGNQAVTQLLRSSKDASASQAAPPVQKKNHTGMPDSLKSGLESLSGMDLSDVRVHYNSSQPAAVQAHAYAQGNEIHVAPGQERHLAHEGWHVVQQRQGRVKPTMQTEGGVPVNDDAGLEREADVMGERAVSEKNELPIVATKKHSNGTQVVQCMVAGLEKYTKPENIQDKWVQLYIDDVINDHCHLSEIDIDTYLREALNDLNWNKEVTLIHNNNHWDVKINKKEILLKTVPDGNCAVHVIDAIINREEITESNDSYSGSGQRIHEVRTFIQNKLNDDIVEVKRRVAEAIAHSESLPECGFGPLLHGELELVINTILKENLLSTNPILQNDVENDIHSQTKISNLVESDNGEQEIVLSPPSNIVTNWESDSESDSEEQISIELVHPKHGGSGELDGVSINKGKIYEDKKGEATKVVKEEARSRRNKHVLQINMSADELADEWAEEQIYNKTCKRIKQLNEAVGTRAPKSSRRKVPEIGIIRDIRHIKFRIESSNDAVKEAVKRYLVKLYGEFANDGWRFTVKFGAKTAKTAPEDDPSSEYYVPKKIKNNKHGQ